MKNISINTAIASMFFSISCITLNAQAGSPIRSATTLSKVYDIDKVYPSMQGPYEDQAFVIDATSPGQFAWMVGYAIEAVDADGKNLVEQEFLCHGHIKFHRGGKDWDKHNKKVFRGLRALPRKWVTLAPGSLEMKTPKGFGIPIFTNEKLLNQTQMLNLQPQRKRQKIRFKTTVRYILDKDLRKPLKALGKTGYTNLFREHRDEPLFAEKKKQAELSPTKLKESSSLEQAPTTNTHFAGAKDDYVEISLPKTFGSRIMRNNLTMHWEVPVGKYKFRTELPSYLPFDTTVHFVSAHLHPYGVKIELWDKTEKRLLFTSYARPNNDFNPSFWDQRAQNFSTTCQSLSDKKAR